MLGFKKQEKDLQMLSDEVVIKVSNLSKCYEIYEQPQDKLKQLVIPPVAKLFGRKQEAKFYKEFWALRDVSFEVKRGETIGIIGKNGSGKSTLLQMICGTLNPTSGDIRTSGRVAALLELGSGFNQEFTGRENVYLNASILGLSKEQIDDRLSSIEAFADIGDFINQPVKTYSSGMMVRLAFAVIAHVDADILVIDEALAVGDAFFTQKCMRFLRQFMETGTVLFVSHDTTALVNLCNKAILLKHGNVLMSGMPKEVAEFYLSSGYESNQDITGVSTIKNSNSTEYTQPEDYKDVREEIFLNSTLRNDIQIFQFNPTQADFGTGLAEIISTKILNPDNQILSWFVGGEDIVLEIVCKANADLTAPIVGFHFKDRLGQIVFCDNTYLSYIHNPLSVESGQQIITKFSFRLPILPPGDYSISPAIATGTQDDHVQHHWIHDALMIKVHTSSICMGLVGLPMKKITLEKI